MTTSSPVNAANIDKSSRRHPLKKRSFIGMTRVMALYKMSDKAFRTMCFIIGAYGDGGMIFFKRSTLAELIQGSTNKVDAAILELKAIGLIDTKNWKGRALQFFLTDKCYDDQPQEVPQNDETRFPNFGEPLIKDKKKGLKETTTSPDHEPIQEPPPKIATQKGPGGPVVDLKKIKEIIDPVIYNAIGSITMKKLCSGKGFETIKFASDRAMKLPLKGKTGLFINTLNDPPPMALSTIGQEVKIKHDMPMQQQQAIKCYNDNIQKIEKNCSAMINGHTPTGNCASYCPYANRRLMK